MSLLDEYDDFDEDDVIEIDTSKKSFPGDIVIYEPQNDRFNIAAARNYRCIPIDSVQDADYILIGIVLRQNEDHTVDVLMCNFLMERRAAIPWDIEYKKTNFIRKNMWDMYKRFIRQFHKKCPKYKALLDMQIHPVSVTDISDICDGINDIFINFKTVVGHKIYTKFIKRLFNEHNHIMCLYNNVIYTATLNLENNPIYEIELPPPYTYDFLCTFRNINITDYNVSYINENKTIKIL